MKTALYFYILFLTLSLSSCSDRYDLSTGTQISYRWIWDGDGRSTFHGYTCQDNCFGHIAGYKWARINAIDDEKLCPKNSISFNEGCAAYVNEHGFLGITRAVIAWIFILTGVFFAFSSLGIRSVYHFAGGVSLIIAAIFTLKMYSWYPLIIGGVIAHYFASAFAVRLANKHP
mgnify:CR=1 FL=1